MKEKTIRPKSFPSSILDGSPSGIHPVRKEKYTRKIFCLDALKGKGMPKGQITKFFGCESPDVL